MNDKFRWGILGTGNIAKQFARGLAVIPDAELVAVGSRAQETADEFGDIFDVPTRHASYEALANDRLREYLLPQPAIIAEVAISLLRVRPTDNADCRPRR